MLPEDPRHGSNAGALAHARSGVPICEPCRVARSMRRKANELARIGGRPGRVPLGETAWHRVVSTPKVQLVAATGYTSERLRRYELGGPTMQVRRETIEKILAANTRWTVIGVQRRLRALSRLGWSGQAMADHSGLGATTLHKLRRNPRPTFVRMRVAEAVVAMYDALSMRPAPTGTSATETRNHAIALGWAPPLAYNNIDDPDEQPKGVGTSSTDRADVMADVDSWGGNATDAARVLGIDRATLQTWAQRHGCSELYRRLAAREAMRGNQWTESVA